MLTNNQAKKILLYGDSLVYGKEPGKTTRWPNRFSYVLQQLLGDSFDIIEEGLRARTLEGENRSFPERDGLKQFGPILGSHLPVKLVVLFLGTNDCNASANKTPEQIANGLTKYPPLIAEWCESLAAPMPRLLIVAPPAINPELYDEAMKKIFDQDSGKKAASLPSLYKQKAADLGADFFDSSIVCEPSGDDGIHLDEDNNRKLAEALAVKLKS